MPSDILEKEAPSVSTKKIKIPVVLLITAGVSEKVTSTLQDGLSRLDVKVLLEPENDIDKAISESDIMVLMNEDEALLKKAWKNGVVPVAKEFTAKINDYNPNTESGNCFVYKNLNEWEIFAAIVRALETYKFPYDWKFIKRSCMKSA